MSCRTRSSVAPCFLTRALITRCGAPVSIRPGRMLLTVMPCPPLRAPASTSRPSVRRGSNWRAPCLDKAPSPRRCDVHDAARNPRPSCPAIRVGPLRRREHVDVDGAAPDFDCMFVEFARRRPPALVTRIWIGPSFRCTVSIMAETCPGSATSPFTKMAPSPSCLSAAAPRIPGR